MMTVLHEPQAFHFMILRRTLKRERVESHDLGIWRQRRLAMVHTLFRIVTPIAYITARIKLTIFPISKANLKSMFIPWYSKDKNRVFKRMQNVIDSSNNGSIVSREILCRIPFRLANSSLLSLAIISCEFGRPKDPTDAAEDPVVDILVAVPLNAISLFALHSLSTVHWLSLWKDSVSLITLKGLAQDFFTSKHFEFVVVGGILIISSLEEVLLLCRWCCLWFGEELIGANFVPVTFVLFLNALLPLLALGDAEEHSSDVVPNPLCEFPNDMWLPFAELSFVSGTSEREVLFKQGMQRDSLHFVTKASGFSLPSWTRSLGVAFPWNK